MRETFDRMWATIREYFSKMPVASRIRLGILAGAVIILAIVAVALLTRTKWVVLPNTGDPNTISDIRAALGGSGIRSRLEDNIIYIPEDSLDQAQMVLYETGLVGTPVLDDSIMEQAATFGVSSEHAKELYDRQMGDWLRTMLMQNPKVKNAIVIASSGDTSPFRIQTNTRKPTASVQLTINEGEKLTKAEVQGIADIVKGAIQGIEYDDISITDNFYKSYTLGDEDEEMQLVYDQRIELQNRLAMQLKMQIEQLLAPVYGSTNLSVQPNVILNFDNTVINKVEFEPPIPGNEEGMLRSSEEILRMQRNWADAMGIPGTDTNELGTGGTPEYPFGDMEDTYFYENIVGLNYELNETRTAIEVANGTIEKLSITVLINSDYMRPFLDEETDEPPPEYTEEVKDAVVTAIGVAKGNVTVSYLPFDYANRSQMQLEELEAAREAQERRDMWIDRAFTYGTILLLAVMVVLLVRSVVKTLRPPPEPELILAADGPGVDIDLLISEEATTVMEQEAAKERELEEIDLNASKSAALEQIERFIEKDAATVAQLLRNWLSDEM